MNKGKTINPSSIPDKIIEISLKRQKPPLFLAEDRKGQALWPPQGKASTPLKPCCSLHSLAHTALEQGNRTKANNGAQAQGFLVALKEGEEAKELKQFLEGYFQLQRNSEINPTTQHLA